MILPEVTPRPGVSKKRSRQQQQSRQRQGSSKRWTLSLTEIPRMLPAAMVMLLSAVPGGSSSSTLSSFFTSALADPASSANLFQNLADDSPLARTMTGCRQVTPSEEASEDRYSVSSPGADPLKLSHGTTTVALVCAGGVVAAVDSRASMGSFVGSRTTQKVIPVSDRILGTMAGGAADCTFWLRYLGMQAKIFEGRNGYPMPVASAAKVLADTLMGQKRSRLSVGTMVMGHDGGTEGGVDGEEGPGSGDGEPGKGGQLYYVDSEGSRVKGTYFSVGSGSTYAYSVLDDGYRPDMSVEEAAALARRAVRHATFRDAFSGGFINVFVVNASGWSRMTVDDAGFLDFHPPGDDEPPSPPENNDEGASLDSKGKSKPEKGTQVPITERVAPRKLESVIGGGDAAKGI